MTAATTIRSTNGTKRGIDPPPETVPVFPPPVVGETERVTVELAVCDAASVAVTFTTNVPSDWGVHVRFPPAGRHPVGSPVQANEYGGMPPLATVVKVTEEPITTDGGLTVREAESGTGGVVTVRDALAPAWLPTESPTYRWTTNWPARWYVWLTESPAPPEASPNSQAYEHGGWPPVT